MQLSDVKEINKSIDNKDDRKQGIGNLKTSPSTLGFFNLFLRKIKRLIVCPTIKLRIFSSYR